MSAPGVPEVPGAREVLGASETLPARTELTELARGVLEAHWQPEGYTVPNLAVYPHQWLWDSCFHAIAWAHLGAGERALTELRNVFAHQADDGFVPHMTYWRHPEMHADFWGRSRTSCITQPPMFGHAIAELVRLGVPVDDDLIGCAAAAMRFLFAARARDHGGIAIVHPWESGCDDSPRWDAWCHLQWDPAMWREEKGQLVRAIQFDEVTGSPVRSMFFDVPAASFGALVAFNALELAPVAGTSDRAWLDAAAQELVLHLRSRWEPELETFADGGNQRSARVRTAEALLPVLCEAVAAPDTAVVDAVFAQLRDPAALGGACGPAQVHRDEPAFDPTVYWRGSSWPQLTYLFWYAAVRLGRSDDAAALRTSAVRGAMRSGFAEHWHPDTGTGYGAVPQSWTTLVAVMRAGAPDQV